jgi:hypothetical protein
MLHDTVPGNRPKLPVAPFCSQWQPNCNRQLPSATAGYRQLSALAIFARKRQLSGIKGKITQRR